MIKLLAVVLAVVLLLNYTVGRNIEIVPDQNENTIFEFEGVDMKIQDGSIDKIVISRFGLHVESMTPYTNLNGIISYTIGARVRGDRLVAQGSNNQSWHSPQNVVTTLSYPPSGIGAQVTYVAIQTNQTTNLGQAYIVKGGIHQRSISVVVEAYNTLYFNYNAAIYGI